MKNFKNIVYGVNNNNQYKKINLNNIKRAK